MDIVYDYLRGKFVIIGTIHVNEGISNLDAVSRLSITG